MRIAFSRFLPYLGAAVLVPALLVPFNLHAQSAQHLVSPSDLQQAAVDASRTRQQNLDTLNDFFSNDKARHAMESANIDPQQVKNGIAGLSDQELAQLSARAQKAQSDFAAGSIGDRDLLVILLCIAALILIIVAVR